MTFDDRDISILFQVAFKGAIEIVKAGEVETDDVLGETFALADAFFDGLKTKIEAESKGKASGSSRKSSGSRSSSGGSKSKASNRRGSGNSTFTIKNPDDPASDAQYNKLESLGWDGDEDLTKGEASDLIQELMG